MDRSPIQKVRIPTAAVIARIDAVADFIPSPSVLSRTTNPNTVSNAATVTPPRITSRVFIPPNILMAGMRISTARASSAMEPIPFTMDLSCPATRISAAIMPNTTNIPPAASPPLVSVSRGSSPSFCTTPIIRFIAKISETIPMPAPSALRPANLAAPDNP